MKEGWRRRVLKRAGWSALFLWVVDALLLCWVWTGRYEFTINSAALSEQRQITVFNAGNGQTQAAIYALDGEKLRHGLFPAIHARIMATLYGEPAPIVIAIHGTGKRDLDFRPAHVQPALWRPNISGRSAQFDIFLLGELQVETERRFGKAVRRYLFGHSLAGFYAIDLASRNSSHGFTAVFTFSPTFSHDLSLISRLEKACANSDQIYANIGLESGRDTEVFDKAKRQIEHSPQCKGRVQLDRHYGIVHQLIMMTGQVQALRTILEE